MQLRRRNFEDEYMNIALLVKISYESY